MVALSLNKQLILAVILIAPAFAAPIAPIHSVQDLDRSIDALKTRALRPSRQLEIRGFAGAPKTPQTQPASAARGTASSEYLLKCWIDALNESTPDRWFDPAKGRWLKSPFGGLTEALGALGSNLESWRAEQKVKYKALYDAYEGKTPNYNLEDLLESVPK